ncbi:50S ribosomal protein L20 [Candidatus Giovannonibacteria bacterium RIFCSPLOWO2_02_FULL_43_11b]|uniref:Large ribosomal subunit protein bL20 n=1 Tax=Candidatus Giovannonibacteria bacterium RIFCSPHIGHO2_12_FULL_43_15 TaxID=1798341 RepID=A0A1F5WR18_9BACT|nr:MAG: 50S ribosomal protein L20 [Candidatus Giovannonibacteria bacterium RIFCSPHIGHO2_01_FULL_43_100]OGF66924.1 MAG: 50S ribosomal protein L20 [Candidatus Giovannonibacteria bacterium RIFCSPHIGHO2_02_FULL_43_32]OGF78106.1 MAG: 50S ribosomal protein L20 [Candidatus Giovannonibacteria bacterium RIFCSPHIGHO2_12_FULL_43_15]OGF78513.1 MAG: 50S ribosomal protein L20 [Candidatus Giovannonibacteria bacterium RIFCSPLOWO2_01_FULL_43_60]OGF89471.1 MAG: 50S ribosomal protein L20 [Candidatus Giovannonibac
MPRVKKATIALKKRRKILKRAKGFRWGAKSKERLARERLLHAAKHSFQDRRKKKRNFRKLWQIQINAAARERGMSYSVLIDKLKKANIGLDRKILAQLAQEYPKAFSALVEKIK